MYRSWSFTETKILYLYLHTYLSKYLPKKLWKIRKRQQGITTCCQIKGMLYVSQWSYIKNSQDRKVCNFMLIVPQWIHSVETLETCFYYYVYNKLWSLCIIFEVVRIITFLLEIYRNVYICVSYIHKYQRSDFACMNSGEDIFKAVSNHFSSWNLLGCV